MSSHAPEVLADPTGVIVDLIARAEPHLDRTTLEEVATSVVGGRAKRRMVAQALLERPAVLTNGRSPASRAVGDLLNALRRAGASSISTPICAECGQQLRTFQRRDQNWSCGVCEPRREPCASCGHVRVVHVRDRQGRPRCIPCLPDEGRDPVDIVMDVVATIDPDLPAEVEANAVAAAVPRSGRRYQLAWALQNRPDLLTGSGAHAPVPRSVAADRPAPRRRSRRSRPTALPALRPGHSPRPGCSSGGHPGRPISAFRLAERLRELGIYSGDARSTALFQLATDLPAAVLAHMFGLHISVAVAWQRASAGDWTSYAAEISRRKDSARE
jgi:hypothetical protein